MPPMVGIPPCYASLPTMVGIPPCYASLPTRFTVGHYLSLSTHPFHCWAIPGPPSLLPVSLLGKKERENEARSRPVLWVEIGRMRPVLGPVFGEKQEE